MILDSKESEMRETTDETQSSESEHRPGNRELDKVAGVLTVLTADSPGRITIASEGEVLQGGEGQMAFSLPVPS